MLAYDSLFSGHLAPRVAIHRLIGAADTI